MKNKSFLFLVMTLGHLLLTSCFLIATFLAIIEVSLKVNKIYENCSGELKYEQNTSYCVKIIDRRLPFETKRELWVTREGIGDYGYMVTYPESHLKSTKELKSKITVTWEPEGVTVSDSGVEVFISQDKFVGGR